PIVEDMGKNSPFGKPTYFEISVAMAFLYFSLHEIDIAVIEVGLGGRLDATNVCDPQLTIITPISFDHMEFLGNTLSEIAREKTGILRPNVKCILAPQEKEAKDTILIEARTKGSQIYMLEEFCQYEILERAPWGSRFRLKISGWGESEVSLRFLGDHQVTNFLVALLASKEWGLPWSEAILTKALRDVYWPGRIEILSHEPLVIFDVAHNQASFSQLRETLRKFLRVEKAIFLLGFLRGKEYWKISQEVVPHSRKILITQPLNPRAADPWEVAPFFQSKDVPVEIVEDPFEAKELAFLYSRESGYPLVIAGSFYLARPFIREFSQSYEEEEVRLC
ncbi:MAG: bifunctional folylpolyglutamate synthase/dihydrofolate synthase, partial [Candidatus Caldatribacteriaceae bacterium]